MTEEATAKHIKWLENLIAVNAQALETAAMTSTDPDVRAQAHRLYTLREGRANLLQALKAEDT